MPLTGDESASRYLGVTGVFTTDPAFAIIKHQLNHRLPHWLTINRAVEDHIGHRLAAQIFSGTLAHNPADSINNIGFTAAIGAHDSTHIAWEIHCSGVDEGLEPRELDRL